MNINKEITTFIQGQSTMVLATIHNEKPYLTPVFFYFNEEVSKFYFVTKRSSRKCDYIEEYGTVSISIYTEVPPVVFTAEGRAQVMDISVQDHKKIVDQLIHLHSTREYYPTPLKDLQAGDIVLVEFEILNYEFDSFKKKNQLS